MKLAWGAKVSRDFARRVIAIADGAFDPSWLMACICFESRFNPAAKNPNSSATGLIQFMRSTAESLGTTVEALAGMPAEEQLNFVAAYFQPYRDRIKTLADCYMAILWPAAVGRDEDAIIFPPGSQAYLANRGLDLDHDGAVTKREAASRVAQLLEQGLLPDNVADIETEAQGGLTMPEIGTAIAGIAGAFNPLLGLGVTLVNSLIDAFSPLARDKIKAELGRHGADPVVAGQFADTLLDAAKNLTGTSDPMDAVVAARKNPAVMKELENSALDRLKELGPLLDKLAELDKATWSAEDEGRDRAGARGRADDVDLGPFLAKAGVAMVCVILITMGAVMLTQTVMNPNHEPSTSMLTMIGPLLGTIFAAFASVFAYRFGSTRASAAKDVTIAEMARR